MASEFLAITAFIAALAVGGVILLFLARRPNREMVWVRAEEGEDGFLFDPSHKESPFSM